MSDQAKALCGPAELIDKLIEFRRSRREGAYAQITDDGLRRLVLLSYFSSQAVEEGRYPRCRLFVPPAGGSDPWQLAKFSQPVSLQQIDDLRRLAPCAASHEIALEVFEQYRREALVSVLALGQDVGPILTLRSLLYRHDAKLVQNVGRRSCPATTPPTTTNL